MDLWERVAVYVTRRSAAVHELLVFDHHDHPEAGTQIPAGGLMPGATPEDAALREVSEETGVVDIAVQRRLGVQRRPHPDTGRPRVTTFIHASTETGDSHWAHHVKGGDMDAGLTFDSYFVPLAQAAGLLPDKQDEFLTSLMLD